MKKGLIFLLFLLLISCSDNDFDNIVVDNGIYKFAYNGKYNICDKNLYVGKEYYNHELSNAQINLFWDDFNIPYKDSIIINKNKDSLFIKDGIVNSILKYKIKIVKDSIFLINNESLKFIAKHKNFLEIIAFSGFYKIYHKSNNLGFGGFDLKGRSFELQSIHNILNENTFSSIDKMKEKEDTVAWCNIYYTFEKVY